MNRKEFIVLLATTCLVIIIWVISDIYHTKASVPILPSLQQALEPINPNFDQTTLDQVKKLSPPQAIVPQPTPTATKISIPSPSPEATEPPQTASPSASILPL